MAWVQRFRAPSLQYWQSNRIPPCTAPIDQNKSQIVPFAWAPPALGKGWPAAQTVF
jgi:hypothetical protein